MQVWEKVPRSLEATHGGEVLERKVAELSHRPQGSVFLWSKPKRLWIRPLRRQRLGSVSFW